MGNIKRTTSEECEIRYQTALETLANRCLGEPYNFHRIAPMLREGMFDGGISSKLIQECLRQFTNDGGYSPQSVGLACGYTGASGGSIDSVGKVVKMAQSDAELDLPAAMDMFLTYHGQWAEIKIARNTEGWVFKGLTSEEIQREYEKARREHGLFSRVTSSDGVEDFEKRLLAAIDGIEYKYPVTPHLAKERGFIKYYEPGDYIVVHALSGVGKTYESLNEVYHLSLQGVPSCLINLENTPANMQKRIWQMHSREWFRPNLSGSDTQMQHYLKCWDEVKKMPFRSYNPGPELPSVVSAIRQDWCERGIQFAVIDYAQLMNIPGYKGARNYELGYISATFRALSLELQIPVMSIVQTKQEVSKQADKRPGFYDIKDCANFGQDATILKSLYRPGYHKITQDENGMEYPPFYAEQLILKGRESGDALAECRFDHIRGFYDAEETTPQQAFTPVDFSAARPGSDEDIPF